MLARENRIRKNSEFDQIYKKSKRIRCNGFTVFIHFTEDNQSTPKFGIVVNKKVGNAVVRNRIKRQFRAIFREVIKNTKPGVKIVIVTYPEINDQSYSDMRSSLSKALQILREI